MLRTISLLAASAALVSAQSVLNTPANIYSCVTAAFPYTCQDAGGCSVIFADYKTSVQLASITSIPTGSGSVSWVPNVPVGTVVMGTLRESTSGATFPTAQLTVEEQLGASACAYSAAVISVYGGAASTAGESAAPTGAGLTTAAPANGTSSSASSAASGASSSASATLSSASSRASGASSEASSAASSASSKASSAASSATSAASSAAASPTSGTSSVAVKGSFLALLGVAGVAALA